jgi:hypothetical protein
VRFELTQELNKQIALLKQRYKELDGLTSISDLLKGGWHDLPSGKRIEELLFELHRDAGVLDRKFHDALVDENILIAKIGQSLGEWYRKTFLTNLNSIKEAYSELDPFLSDFFDKLDEVVRERYENQEVEKTFYAGLEQIQGIIDDNPDMVERFALDDAWRVIDSEFLDFSPDEWIERSRRLKPIFIEVREEQIPAHVRFRLRELYRVFVLGNWFSVFSLARTILEYSIINLAFRYELDPFVKRENGTRRIKRLGVLVSEMSERLPNIKDDMESVTEYGNRFLHPKKKDNIITYPKIVMETALDTIRMTKHIVEVMYVKGK